MTRYVPLLANIGRNSYVGENFFSVNLNTRIGSFTSLGNAVRLGHGTHPLNYLTTSPYLYLDRLGFKTNQTPSHNEWEKLEPVYIGNDVWIGDNVWIKNGITVGDGAIIGAHAVVTHNVPPYAIVAGNPAQILKYRFTPEIIADLLNLKWWELPDEVIKTLPYDNIQECIERLHQIKGDTPIK